MVRDVMESSWPYDRGRLNTNFRFDQYLSMSADTPFNGQYMYMCSPRWLFLATQYHYQGLWEWGSVGTGFSRYIGTGPGEPIRGPWIPEGSHSLSHRRFILIFSFFMYFQLKSSIFRKVSACPRGPKAVLFCLAKFLLEALPNTNITLSQGSRFT
jgi:hypothetical protein